MQALNITIPAGMRNVLGEAAFKAARRDARAAWLEMQDPDEEGAEPDIAPLRARFEQAIKLSRLLCDDGTLTADEMDREWAYHVENEGKRFNAELQEKLDRREREAAA